MEIARGAGQFDFVVIQAAQAVCDRWDAFAEHGSVGDEQCVRLQFFLVTLDVVPQADAADLFFTFDQHFDINGKFSVQLMQRFERLNMNMDLAFIIGRAAPKDISIAHFRLEGGGGPEFQRLGGLYIIVAVEKNGRLARSFEGFGVNEGVETGRNDFNCFEAGGTKTIGNPLGSAIDIRFVLAFGTDGGDAEKFVELAEMLLAATFYKFSKVHMRPPGAMIIIQIYFLNYLKMMKKSAAAV